MQKKVIILILLLSNLIHSQNEERKIDSLASAFTSELKINNINEFLTVKRYCIGAERLTNPNKPDKCDMIEPYYEMFIFWSSENKYWIKKFDNCGAFKKVKMTNSIIIDFFRENQVKISKEVVKKYTTEENKKNNEYLSVDHSCFRTIEFHTKFESIKKSFDLFDLSSQQDDKNLYYESNNKLKLIEFNELFNKQITRVASNEEFVRIK